MSKRRRQRQLIVNPFVSSEQQKACYAKQAAGEADGWDCDEWQSITPKKLPERKRPIVNAASRKALKLKLSRKSGKVQTGPTPRQVDPSGTLPMQRVMIDRLRRQFALVAGAISKLVGVDDAFGLEENAREVRVVAEPVQNFDPDQARDADGKFAAHASETVEKGKTSGHEHAIIADRHGNKIAEDEGEEGTVDPSHPDLYKAGAGLHLIHNHPDDSPLSPEDLKAFAKYPGVDRITAKGHGGKTYSVKVTGSRDDLYRAVNDFEGKVSTWAADELMKKDEVTSEDRKAVKAEKFRRRGGVADEMTRLGLVSNLSLADRVEAAAVQTHTEPTPQQVEAGNYRKGRVTIQGIPVVIENPAGSIRTKVGSDGSSWSREIAHHYGYISRTMGVDGDHVDVFVGPEPESDRVFVIEQQRPCKVENQFCATGSGGGIDATCSPVIGGGEREKITLDHVSDPEGEDTFDVKVIKNPTKEDVEKKVSLLYGGAMVKGLVIGNDVYVWTSAEEDIHHSPVAAALGHYENVPFEDRLMMTREDDGKVGVDARSRSAKVDRWVAHHGFTFNQRGRDEFESNGTTDRSGRVRGVPRRSGEEDDCSGVCREIQNDGRQGVLSRSSVGRRDRLLLEQQDGGIRRLREGYARVENVADCWEFDEHKVLLGFHDRESAVAGYLANYPSGWRLGPVTEMSVAEFKGWLGGMARPTENSNPNHDELGRFSSSEATVDSIQELCNDYEHYGLRQISDADEDVDVGDRLAPSRVWADDSPTDDTLDGTSTTKFDPDNKESIRRAIDYQHGYSQGDKWLVVGSDRIGDSIPEDPGERVLKNPTVLGILRRPVTSNVDDVPAVRQWNKWSCGAAVAAMLGEKYGVGPETQEGWEQLVGADPKNGTSPKNLIAGLESLGLEVEWSPMMTVEELAERTRGGDPVLCPIQSCDPITGNSNPEGINQYTYSHSVVESGHNAGLHVVAAFQKGANGYAVGEHALAEKAKIPAGFDSSDMVGFAAARPNKDGTHYIAQVHTDEPHRRRGVASSMYDELRGRGVVLGKSPIQTDLGDKFRASYQKRRNLTSNYLRCCPIQSCDPITGNSNPEGCNQYKACGNDYPKAGAVVDGLRVSKIIPDKAEHLASIEAATEGNARSIGVRELRIADMAPYLQKGIGERPTGGSRLKIRQKIWDDEDRRIESLKEHISKTGEIQPIIVVDNGSGRGAYTLDGAHRIAALLRLGKKSVPALVILDAKPTSNQSIHCGHWVAVVGASGGEVVFRDPQDEAGLRRMPEREWLANWRDVDADGNEFVRFGVVVLGVTENSFCATGEGGGVDPSCSKNVDYGILTKYATRPESLDLSEKEHLAEIAALSKTQKEELIRISSTDRKHSIGDIIDFGKTPVSFSGSVKQVLRGDSIGHIGWKSSDECLYKIENPKRGLDVDYSKLGSMHFSASGENETITSGRYRVVAVGKVTEPGTNKGYGYKTRMYKLEEINDLLSNRRLTQVEVDSVSGSPGWVEWVGGVPTVNSNPEGHNQYTEATGWKRVNSKERGGIGYGEVKVAVNQPPSMIGVTLDSEKESRGYGKGLLYKGNLYTWPETESDATHHGGVAEALGIPPEKWGSDGYKRVYLHKKPGEHLKIRVEGGKGPVEELSKKFPGTLVENYEGQPRDDHGRFDEGSSGSSSHVEETAKQFRESLSAADPHSMAYVDWKEVGGMFSEMEHIAKDWISDGCERNVSKLPGPIQKGVRASYAAVRIGIGTAFSAWTATQALAERVSIERGHTPEEAKKLRGVLSGIDIMAFKPVAFATAGSAGLAAASWIVPPATGAYLAYSTARNPIKTARAAYKLVRDSLKTGTEKAAGAAGQFWEKVHGTGPLLTSNAAVDNVNQIADALERHGYSDWHVALLSAAVDETGDVGKAIGLADELARRQSTENIFCATGEGGGVDPTCSGSSKKQRDELLSWSANDSNNFNPDMKAVNKRLTEIRSSPYVPQEVRQAIHDAIRVHPASENISIEKLEEVAKKANPKVTSDQVLKVLLNGVENNQFRAVAWTQPLYQMRRPDLAMPLSNEIRYYYRKAETANTALTETGDVGMAIGLADELAKTTENSFCPTGEGGGVDPTCSPQPTLTWSREHKSSDGRWRVSQAVRSGNWTLYDSHTRDKNGASESTIHSSLANAKRYAQAKPRSEQQRLAENIATNADYSFHADPEKIKKFQTWLKKKLQQHVVGKAQEALWEEYARQGYMKGAGRSWEDVNGGKKYAKGYAQDQSTADFYAGGKEEFLKSSFGQPVAVEKVKLMAGRAFDDLENVTADMSTKMSRVLTDGLVQGKHPRDVARDLVNQVDVSRVRAETIARTELIRCHAEGQLTALEKLGVKELEVDVEYSTALDELVCPICSDLEGQVFEIADARGLIPQHPNCRCAWRPSSKFFPTRNQHRLWLSLPISEKERLTQAATQNEMWEAGYELRLPVQNAFCPTGPGGGHDPTCSPVKGLPPVPKFVSSDKANVAKNEKAVAEMRKLAEAGDKAGLAAHPGTPSPKVQEYKKALLAAVKTTKPKQAMPEPEQHEPSGIDHVMAAVSAKTGYSPQQIRDAINGDASPGHDAAVVRAKVTDAILTGGHAVKDAVLQIKDDQHEKASLIGKIASGDVALAQKEYASTPTHDLRVLSSISVSNQPIQGQAVCNMASRSLKMGSTSVTGDFRHELGHAVRSALGGKDYNGKTAVTDAAHHEYEKLKMRLAQKKDELPKEKSSKVSGDWYQEHLGAISRRAFDNWEEHFAEHYRGYHRAIFRDQSEGGGGKHLTQYRQWHPGYAKIFDAHYTAALLGGGK